MLSVREQSWVCLSHILTLHPLIFVFTNKVFLPINNPLISKKIDVVKTCQSNIIRVDVTNRNGFVMLCSRLHHHNIMGTHQFSPHLYVFSHDQLRRNWSRFYIYWYENIFSEMTKYQLARKRQCPSTEWRTVTGYLISFWYENLDKYCPAAGTRVGETFHITTDQRWLLVLVLCGDVAESMGADDSNGIWRGHWGQQPHPVKCRHSSDQIV